MTSTTGAALRDVLQVLRRRCRGVPVLIYPVPVQGAGAAREIASQLALADRRSEVDVLLLVRGGGSLEDLWAFNEEILARALAAVTLPVITGIGHEIDFTIADFVADVRAPTPSAAAELAVPEAGAWIEALEVTARRLTAAIVRSVRERREAVTRSARRLTALHPAQAIAQRAQRLDELQSRALAAARRAIIGREQQVLRIRAELETHSPASRVATLLQRAAHARARLAPAIRHAIANCAGRLQSAARGLQATSPLATLDRGYSIVTLATTRTVVTDAGQAPVGAEIEARLSRGRLHARVTGRSG